MPTGYCTVEDVRRLLQEAEFSGALVEDDNQAVVDAIAAQTEWLEKTTKRHWYAPEDVAEDDHDLIPTDPRERDDEEDIPTPSAFVAGDSVDPKVWHQGYTKVRLNRRDAQSISQLLVASTDGYEDWVATDDYDGGTWPDALGDDYYLRINDGGWTDLYLDVESLDPDLDRYANAVYITFEYGSDDVTTTVRRGVAALASLKILADDAAALGIPDDGNIVPAESKIDVIEREAERLLEVHR